MVSSDREPYDADALVDVAVRVFLDRGYDRASMIDVARAARLGKSSLYHHVAGKEELLERAVRRALDALFASLEAPECTRGPAADRLAAVIRHTVEIMCEQPAEVALLLRVRGNTEAERWAAERRREFDRIVTDLVREAVAEGDLRDDLEPGLVTRLVFGMSNSVVEWYRPEGRIRPGDIVDTILAIVFDGLRRPPTPRKDRS
ncbi:MAG TPA: TetR/AcrR family transcriptional regulator [Acidimicrobiia bacterium]